MCLKPRVSTFTIHILCLYAVYASSPPPPKPSVSVGNVAQLAVDLLISSLRLSRVGWLRDPALLPLVGNDAFDHTPSRRAGYLHTAAEGVRV